MEKSKNYKLFKKKIFDLPKSIGKKHFPEFVSNHLADYLDEILLFEGELGDQINKNFKKISTLCSSINEAINFYYLGDIPNAFKKLEKGLKSIESFLTIKGKGISSERKLSLYRARIGGNESYSPKEMFHIPFQLREKVSSQRFSIPGLPCLYLGNSIYVCWEELGKPDINLLQVTRLETSNDKLVLLDFSFTTSHLASVYKYAVDSSNFKGFENLILEFLVKYPLVFVSTLKVINRNASFKPEYIIPQLLLQWVSLNKKVDGIIYFSSRPDSNFESFNGANLNYVIPVKTVSDKGYCKKLINDFKVSNSISWQLVNLSSFNYEKLDDKLDKFWQKVDFRNPGPSYLELVKGKSQMYHKTIFGKLEIILDEMDVYEIKNTTPNKG